MSQVGWVLDHPRDLAADFRYLFHLSPAQALSLPGPEYLALAYRTTALNGVMAARAAALDSPESTTYGGQQATEVPSDRGSIQAHPVLSGLIDF